MTRRAAAGAAVLALSAAITTTAWAEPPRWVVRDADSQLVLFGTIHLLPDQLEWQSEAMLNQLEAAEEVWFEADPGALQGPDMQQLVMQQGMDMEQPLSDKLDAALYERLVEQAGSLGLSEQQLAIMQPWLASITISTVALMRAGFNPAAGVETRLHGMLEGQEVRAFETPADQVRMLAELPEELQVDLLASTLDELDENTERFRELADDWAQGEIAGLEELLVETLETDYPQLYEIVFTRRNADWVDQIEAELAGSGTDFVAVGAGHLIGRNSVVEMLRERGWTVERVDDGPER